MKPASTHQRQHAIKQKFPARDIAFQLDVDSLEHGRFKEGESIFKSGKRLARKTRTGKAARHHARARPPCEPALEPRARIQALKFLHSAARHRASRIRGAIHAFIVDNNRDALGR